MSDHRIIHGNITRDPELRNAGESDVASFGVAINSKFKDKDEVHFVNCEAWNKLGENICNFFDKGQEIMCWGRMKTERWEKDGEKKSKDIMVVLGFDFCGKKD